MNKRSSKTQTEQGAPSWLVTKLDQMASDMLSLRKDFAGFKEMMTSFDDRLMMAEKSIRDFVATPQGSSPIRRPRQLSELSPAYLQTLQAARELAPRPGQWVTVKEIAARTGRSVVTESNYAKDMSKLGWMDRRPQLQEAGKGRKVRILLYQPRN